MPQLPGVETELPATGGGSSGIGWALTALTLGICLVLAARRRGRGAASSVGTGG
jgi:LPXTG-motif cell wall-anchored protein